MVHSLEVLSRHNHKAAMSVIKTTIHPQYLKPMLPEIPRLRRDLIPGQGYDQCNDTKDVLSICQPLRLRLDGNLATTTKMESKFPLAKFRVMAPSGVEMSHPNRSFWDTLRPARLSDRASEERRELEQSNPRTGLFNPSVTS